VPTLTKRKVNGQNYYYLVRSARINGKPRIVEQIYLGNVEKIEEMQKFFLDGGIPEADGCNVYNFAAVTALLSIAERIEVQKIIDKHAVKRAQGLSVGESMVLAAINRATDQVSKNSFYSWFKKTVLSNSFPNANEKNLSSQGFWNNMSIIDKDMICEIENEITSTIIEKYDISTDCLLFDHTNFFTFISSTNPAKLPKRGHSKEKRTDLKIVGLSLMVSPDFNVPLFHDTYSGNSNDAKQFSSVIESMKKRYLKITGGKGKITLVFDKGNNSLENISKLLEDKPLVFNFVGGLRLNQCPELREISKKNFTRLNHDDFDDTKVFRTTKDIYGINSTVIVTDNPELFEAQMRGVGENIEKCKSELDDLMNKLKLRADGQVTKGKKYTLESVEKRVSSILSREYMKSIIDYNIKYDAKSDEILLNYELNKLNISKLQEDVLGKTILFTNNHDWSSEKIVSAYRAQYHVEETFRQLKDTKHLSFRPVRHFTDDNIIVHAFYCVLSLILCSILKLELSKMGYDMSINAIISTFSEVRQVSMLFSKKSKKIQRASFSAYEGVAKEYIERYGLKKMALKL
jgi:transposase